MWFKLNLGIKREDSHMAKRIRQTVSVYVAKQYLEQKHKKIREIIWCRLRWPTQYFHRTHTCIKNWYWLALFHITKYSSNHLLIHNRKNYVKLQIGIVFRPPKEEFQYEIPPYFNTTQLLKKKFVKTMHFCKIDGSYCYVDLTKKSTYFKTTYNRFQN